MSNVIKINRESNVPVDLMTFGEVEKKYKLKYHTLYKYTRQICEIPIYTRGGLRVSEQDIKSWLAGGLMPAQRSKA